VKKQEKKKSPRVRKPVEETVELNAPDWKRLFAAFREAFDWALDVAAALARDFPEEVEAVERVRVFMRARLAGQSVDVSIDDVLFTFGLLIGAIERDLGPINMLGPWFAPPMTMHFPAGTEQLPRVPRVLIRRPTWSRASTQFIA
jgi:hypothetical protein